MSGKVFLFILLQAVWVTAFSQSLSLARLGDRFQCTNLAVHWEATNVLPRKVWVYRVLPKVWPAAGLSNLVAACGFTAKNLVNSNADSMLYAIAGKWDVRHPDKSLGISGGNVFYWSLLHYSPTNLAKNVPETNQLMSVTTNFLKHIGFNLSELPKRPDGIPKIRFVEPFKEYFLPNGTIITNIEFREARFGRAVDGIKILNEGGYGDIQFSELGKPVQIDISWPDFKRYKRYKTAKQKTIIEWIRDGKAVQGGIPMNIGSIDWPTVKSLTVKEANLAYYAGDNLAPSPWLMPLVSLWTTVDTGQGNIDVEIDCPIIDETK
jgi:hypothetical protein